MTAEEFSKKLRELINEVDADVDPHVIQRFLFGAGMLIGKVNGFEPSEGVHNFIHMTSSALEMPPTEAAELVLIPLLKGAGIDIEEERRKRRAGLGIGPPRRGKPRRGVGRGRPRPPGRKGKKKR